jgi:hypothetical protein
MAVFLVFKYSATTAQAEFDQNPAKPPCSADQEILIVGNKAATSERRKP